MPIAVASNKGPKLSLTAKDDEMKPTSSLLKVTDSTKVECGEETSTNPTDSSVDNQDFSRAISNLLGCPERKKGLTFPAKLHKILSDPELEHVIIWLPHGRSWKIMDKTAFEKKVIPAYFGHSRLASFSRQVSGWGFKRVGKGVDKSSYYHPLFLRGMPQLCLEMSRLVSKGTRKPYKDGNDVTPDFYKMSEENPLPESTALKPHSDSMPDAPSAGSSGIQAFSSKVVGSNDLGNKQNEILITPTSEPDSNNRIDNLRQHTHARSAFTNTRLESTEEYQDSSDTPQNHDANRTDTLERFVSSAHNQSRVSGFSSINCSTDHSKFEYSAEKPPMSPDDMLKHLCHGGRTVNETSSHPNPSVHAGFNHLLNFTKHHLCFNDRFKHLRHDVSMIRQVPFISYSPSTPNDHHGIEELRSDEISRAHLHDKLKRLFHPGGVHEDICTLYRKSIIASHMRSGSVPTNGTHANVLAAGSSLIYAGSNRNGNEPNSNVSVLKPNAFLELSAQSIPRADIKRDGHNLYRHTHMSLFNPLNPRADINCVGYNT